MKDKFFSVLLFAALAFIVPFFSNTYAFCSNGGSCSGGPDAGNSCTYDSDCNSGYCSCNPTNTPKPAQATNTPVPPTNTPKPATCSRNVWGPCSSGSQRCVTESGLSACSDGTCGCYSNQCSDGAGYQSCGGGQNPIVPTNTPPTENTRPPGQPNPTSTPPSTNTPTPPQLPSDPGYVNDIEITDPSTKLYYPLVTRNWPSRNPGQTQWSHIVLSNPNNQEATVTIHVYSAYEGTISIGTKLRSYSITIPPHGWYSSFNDTQWTDLPDNYSPDGIQTLGSLEVESTLPISGLMRWQLRQGSTSNSPVTIPHDTPLVAHPSKILHYPLIVQNWQSSGATTQWSDIILFNPHVTDVAKVSIHLYDATKGTQLATIEKTIPPKGTYLSSNDQEDWAGLSKDGKRILATMTITSDGEIVALNRWRRVEGDGNLNATAKQIVDSRFTLPSSSLFYPLFLRNWRYTSSGYTQWSDVLLYNPHSSPVKATVHIYNNTQPQNKPAATFTITIPARQYYNSFKNKDWDNLPDSDSADGTQSNVSLSIGTPESTPITGLVRLRIQKGTSTDDESYLIQDNPLLIRKPTLNTVVQTVPLIVRGTNSGMASTRVWSDIILFNTTETDKKVTFRINSADSNNTYESGQPIRIFQEIIPANGFLNTYGLGQWHALPITSNNPTSTRASGEIIHEPGIVAIQRMRYLSEEPLNTCLQKSTGDADCNNKVANADYDIWRREYKRELQTTISDFNNDGRVKAIDFEIWRRKRFSSSN